MKQLKFSETYFLRENLILSEKKNFLLVRKLKPESPFLLGFAKVLAPSITYVEAVEWV